MSHPIGFIPYLNMAPFHRDFGPGPAVKNGLSFEFRRVSPRNLGIEAENNQVIAGALSLMDFFRLSDWFEPVGRFGIGVRHAAGSVLLFSKKPIAELSGEVAVTDETATSVRLLQVLLEKKYSRPAIQYGRIASSLLFDGNADALLLIGNEALQAKKSGIKGFPVVTDLGEEWFDWQKTPFVFARWAVRKDAPADVKRAIAEALADSLEREETLPMESIVQGFSASGVQDYWKNFVYELTPAHEQAIEKFQELSLCLTR